MTYIIIFKKLSFTSGQTSVHGETANIFWWMNTDEKPGLENTSYCFTSDHYFSFKGYCVKCI